MNPTERFTERADNYVRYRPGYPDIVVETLQREAGLVPGSLVADIGCGTGISSELLLRHGYDVVGVEPNEAMRIQAQRWLGENPRFRLVDGTGEATTLADASVDAMLCAQAFHWLDAAAARAEMRRILKPGGLAILLWNLRQVTGAPFQEGLEEVLQRFSDEYRLRVHPETVRAVRGNAELFAGDYQERVFVHAQHFDWEGLKGRMLSASYVPLQGNPLHEAFVAELRRQYDAHNEAGFVSMPYDCRLAWGRLQR